MTIAAVSHSTLPLSDRQAFALDRLAILPSEAGAYQWWYFDAISHDGRYGLVAIFFIGGVFSSLYADRWAAGDRPSPWDHPMVNLALYERGTRRAWVFSEYPRECLHIDDPELSVRIGGSALRRGADGSYEFEVDDDDFFPRRRSVQAKVRFSPEDVFEPLSDARLSANARHQWASPAPRCRVQVESTIGNESVTWSGHGYHDVNRGWEPLQDGFRHWTWGRVRVGDGLRILYDATEVSGLRTRRLLAESQGRWSVSDVPSPVPATGRTGWMMSVPDRLDFGTSTEAPIAERQRIWWESSPFYARWANGVDPTGGAPAGVCEHVDLQRFSSPIVRFMIRHRTYRRPGVGAPPLPAQVSARRLFGRGDGIRGDA